MRIFLVALGGALVGSSTMDPPIRRRRRQRGTGFAVLPENPANLNPPLRLLSIPEEPIVQMIEQKYIVREPYVLELEPYVQIGISAIRTKKEVPPGRFAVCPSNRAYCIDHKASDNATCMYPSPVEIKQCYDASCVESAWGPIVYKQQGEDTYCKDFMTPQGRLCQWVDSLPCTCDTKNILYYDAEFIPEGENIPPGFSKPDLCTYPLDLIRKAAEEAALLAREKRNNATRRPRRKPGLHADDDDNGKDDRSSNPSGKGRKRVAQSEDDKGVFPMHRVVHLIMAVVALIT